MVVTATVGHAEEFAPLIRDVDREEIRLLSGQTDMQDVLTTAIKQSPDVQAVYVDGEPAALYGVGMLNLLTGWGSPWMLGTPLVDANPRLLLQHSRKAMNRWTQEWSCLENLVWEGNEASVRWLRWLGFTIEEAVPVRDGMFHHFHWRSHV